MLPVKSTENAVAKQKNKGKKPSKQVTKAH